MSNGPPVHGSSSAAMTKIQEAGRIGRLPFQCGLNSPPTDAASAADLPLPPGPCDHQSHILSILKESPRSGFDVRCFLRG